MLVYRSVKTGEISYVTRLARNEINIKLRRLDRYKTYLVYNGCDRVGCVSFGFKPDRTIYIYILVFEKQAQRQGFAADVFEALMRYGQKKDTCFSGLSATIHRVNERAINAAIKHGFTVTGELTKYLHFRKPND